MTDSKEYFDSLEPKATPRVEVLAADLADCQRWIRVLYRLRHLPKDALVSQIEETYRAMAKQLRIIPRK